MARTGYLANRYVAYDTTTMEIIVGIVIGIANSAQQITAVSISSSDAAYDFMMELKFLMK